ncbi:hypothetical protein DENSPDRAFT_153917 [Dentipellis sp. KUC8613]|nr:hypothetical protein DENSPDRAFT_153917 [Dentipellis sp. KUC8613]
MSVNFNPYVQGWAHAGNAPSGSGQPWGYDGQPPSVFGALPSFNSTLPKLPPPSEFAMYHITGFSPTILNASVVGPRGQTHLRIITDPASPHHTIWRDAQRRTVAMVDWGTRSTVEMPGLLARQSVRSWLRLSSDRTTRTMEVRGMHYAWAPVDQYICLYYTHGSQSVVLARVCRVADGVSVEVTQRAMQYGLLEVCILCATLFLCGQNID